MKIDVKGGADHSAKLVNMKTNLFGEDRETKMIGAQKFHMKIKRSGPQKCLQSQCNWFLYQAEKISPEGDTEERAIRSGVGMVYRRFEEPADLVLKL